MTIPPAVFRDVQYAYQAPSALTPERFEAWLAANEAFFRAIFNSALESLQAQRDTRDYACLETYLNQAATYFDALRFRANQSRSAEMAARWPRAGRLLSPDDYFYKAVVKVVMHAQESSLQLQPEVRYFTLDKFL